MSPRAAGVNSVPPELHPPFVSSPQNSSSWAFAPEQSTGQVVAPQTSQMPAASSAQIASHWVSQQKGSAAQTCSQQVTSLQKICQQQPHHRRIKPLDAASLDQLVAHTFDVTVSQGCYHAC